MKRLISSVLASALLFFATAAPAGAAAPPPPPDAAPSSLSMTGKRAKIVAKSAIYGMGGGFIIGLASQVFKKNTQNIFLFGSLGLYAGIALGVYVISTSSGPQPYEGPDTYDDFSWNHSTAPLELASETRFVKKETKVNLWKVSF